MTRTVAILVILFSSYACAYTVRWPTRARTVQLCASEAPAEMRVKALKEELDERGVAWRGVAFEKAELVNLLVEARARPPEPEPVAEPAAAPEPEPAAAAADAAADADDDEGAAYAAAYEAALADALKLKTKELRTELAARSVGWADLYEKEELAARLAGLVAKAAGFSRSGALTPGAVNMVDDDQLVAEMADERTPLLVDVFATWCGPCKLIAPMLEEIAGKAGERLRVAKIDSDEYPELSTELRVSGLPTIIFISGAKEVHRLEGVPGNAAALEGLVRQHLGVEL